MGTGSRCNLPFIHNYIDPPSPRQNSIVYASLILLCLGTLPAYPGQIILPTTTDNALAGSLPPESGTVAFYAAQNFTNFSIALNLRYWDATGAEYTPSPNTYVIAPHAGIMWRPFVDDPILEGPGASVPNKNGGSSLVISRPDYAGPDPFPACVVEYRNSQYGISASERQEDEGSSTLIVPYFRDDAAGFPPDSGTAAFIFVTNPWSSQFTMALTYRTLDGQDRTPVANTFVVPGYGCVYWRPLADDAVSEGPGASVPNMLFQDGDSGEGVVYLYRPGSSGWNVQVVQYGARGGRYDVTSYSPQCKAGDKSGAVPYYRDDAPSGQGFFPVTGTTSLLIVHNDSATSKTMTVRYCALDGTVRETVGSIYTFNLAAYSTVVWRPNNNDPSVERGVSVPKPSSTPTSLTEGSICLTWPGSEPLATCLIQSDAVDTHSTRLSPSFGEGGGRLAVPLFIDDAPAEASAHPTSGTATTFYVTNTSQSSIRKLAVAYWNRNGTLCTETVPLIDIGPLQTVSWRPAAKDPFRESTQGMLLSNMTAGDNVGSAVICGIGSGGLIGYVVMSTASGSAAYAMPGSDDISMTTTDTDGDAFPDWLETAAGTNPTDVNDYPPPPENPDTDGDGIIDSIDGVSDSDSDGRPNYLDGDSDSDGIPDILESATDTDTDSTPDFLDTDSDGDDIPDSVEGITDTDEDSSPDYLDTDSDDDGIPDATEGATDADSDTTPNYLDWDSDNDTLPDAWEFANDLDPLDDGGVDPDNGANGDPDGDGATNTQEFVYGSDPQDAGSAPMPALGRVGLIVLFASVMGLGLFDGFRLTRRAYRLKRI